jgi:hypothetical protein
MQPSLLVAFCQLGPSSCDESELDNDQTSSQSHGKKWEGCTKHQVGYMWHHCLSVARQYIQHTWAYLMWSCVYQPHNNVMAVHKPLHVKHVNLDFLLVQSLPMPVLPAGVPA